jgi:DNA-binding FadR family transcriptional regulator
LAQEFDVSPAVIREATERLRTKGLVKSRQGAGCMVLTHAVQEGFLLELPSPIDKKALRHIYELRLEVEGGAAALAAVHATAADIKQMERVLAALEKTLSTPDKALEWDLKFHQKLAMATHNPHYSQLLKYLTNQWRHSVKAARQNTFSADQIQNEMSLGNGRTLGDDGIAVGLARQVHDEHVAVLEAIAQRDPIAARTSAQTHLRNACERLGLALIPTN